MTAPTAAELIRQAYVLAQVWDPGEEQPGVEGIEGLFVLNTIIADWSSVGTLIPAYKTLSIALTTGDYMVVKTPPITEIIEANIIDSGNIVSDLREINLQQFNLLNFTQTQDRPKSVYIESKEDAIQTSTNVYFWPTADQNYTATLRVKQFMAELDYSDQITTLPLNYFKALKYQLAKDLADIYLTVLSDRFDTEYKTVLARLKAVNRKDLSVQNSNPFLEGRRYRPWNIYAG